MPFLDHLVIILLVWSHADEQYCRDYHDNRGLARLIVSQLEVIEQQRGRLDVLIAPDYHVSFFISRFSLL